jgi:hypothetical protein
MAFLLGVAHASSRVPNLRAPVLKWRVRVQVRVPKKRDSSPSPESEN